MIENKDVTILVVDDNQKNLQVVGSFLHQSGYKVLVSLSGSEALGYASQKTPDLILLDITMPEMDGYETCELLKKGKTTKNIPVIFLTARNDRDSIIRGFQAGGIDFISKPFFKEELLARVEAQLKLKMAYMEIKQLRGLIPICASCKKIKDDEGYWQEIEKYIAERSEAAFSHGICYDCAKKLYPDIIDGELDDPSLF